MGHVRWDSEQRKGFTHCIQCKRIGCFAHSSRPTSGCVNGEKEPVGAQLKTVMKNDVES
jgi:hypothetical protein